MKIQRSAHSKTAVSLTPGRQEYLHAQAYNLAAAHWIVAPEGLWSVWELDGKTVTRICYLLGCKREELLGILDSNR